VCQAPPARAPRVLVLDQDTAVRQALCFSLGLEGYRVEPFGDAESFANRLHAGDVDAVIIGHAPPAIAGPPLARAARHAGQGVAILMTATHPTTDLRRAARVDGVSLIEKPLMGDALLLVLEAALRGVVGAQRPGSDR
jgi:DNA-binding response OmpR family regulator